MNPIRLIIILCVTCSILFIHSASAQEQADTRAITANGEEGEEQDIIPALINGTIFDDTLLLEGFTKRYEEESKETLLAMIQDETIDDIKVAAAVRAFRKRYALEIFSKEKEAAEHILIRQLNRSQSAFIDLEIMHTLCLMDRYKYFHSFIPQIIQKLDHYNDTVNESAYNATMEIIEKGNNRAREARIVFNTLRNILFLSRKRLAQVETPNQRLQQKLTILKWSIKILGSQEIKRLPKEVLNLL